MTVRFSRNSPPLLRRWAGLPARGLSLVLLAAACFGLGCQAVEYPNAILGADGDPVRMGHIQDILEDDTLTDFEKDRALEALGIEDELVRRLLIEIGVGG